MLMKNLNILKGVVSKVINGVLSPVKYFLVQYLIWPFYGKSTQLKGNIVITISDCNKILQAHYISLGSNAYEISLKISVF